MLTDTARGPTDAGRFVAARRGGEPRLFGLLRLNWIEAHVVLPFTRVQAGLAAALFGAPALPVEATLACSGADALALCLGAVLAYPVTWRTRLAGAAGGAALSSASTRCGSARSDGRPRRRRGSTRCTCMSGRRCSRWRSPGMCSRGCASRTPTPSASAPAGSAVAQLTRGARRNHRGGSSCSR